MQWLVEDLPTDRYAAAAEAFRVPYWDWALGDKGGGVPDFFLTQSIDVVRLNGSEDTIRNPLYSYRFHPVEDGHFQGKVRGLREVS